METTTAIEFSILARRVADVANRHGLDVPAFRTPPRMIGRERTVRRLSGGTCLVSVAIRGRDNQSVLLDMVSGVIVANGLIGRDADEIRAHFLSEIGPAIVEAA